MYPECIKLDMCDSLQKCILGLKKPLILRKEKAEKVGDPLYFCWRIRI